MTAIVLPFALGVPALVLAAGCLRYEYPTATCVRRASWTAPTVLWGVMRQRQVLVVAVAVLWTSIAHAEVPRRTFKALGDVAYVARDGEASCGKASRDMIKDTVKAARTITITSTQLRMNNGDAWTIESENSEGLFSGKSYPAPTESHPRRMITMVMGVTVFDDDATFVLARSAESDGRSCSDSYRVSIE